MRGRRRWALTFVCLAALVVALVGANLCLGSVNVEPGELLRALVGTDRTSTTAQVLWGIRLPRLVAACLLGGALALSGVLLQAFFNNPLAGPYILGISNGAKLAVAAVMIVGVGAAGVMSSWMAIAAAFVGSLAVMCLMLLVSRRIRSASTLVVAGVMLGYICSALTDFLITFANDASIVSLRNWSMGSFSGTNWDDVRAMALVVVVASCCVFLLTKPLSAYLLGERYAQSVGVNVRAFRRAIIVLSSLLAACVTAFAGPISFVGIAVPHIVKRLFGTSKPIVVVPGAFLGGAAFCLLCDLVARTAFTPTEMSVSTVTAVFGAPVVVWVLLGKQRKAPRSGHAQATDATEPSRRASAGATPHAAAPSTLAAPASPAAPSAFALQPHAISVAQAASATTHAISSETQSQPDSQLGSAPHASAAQPHAVLQTNDLSVGYDARGVVRDVNMDVSSGTIVTLIGPNGAGKSTMLATFAGLLPALGGTILLDDKDLRTLSAHELAMVRAVLLTERPRTELLTCEDVVEAGRHPYTGRMGVLSPADRARVCEAMQAMQVWDLRDRDFMQISDGQRQRVLLARALCQDPSLLVLDEPTSYLDIRYQIELFDVLRRLAQEQGLGVVMSLHELSFARRASDRIVCVKNGVVFAQGTPDEMCAPAVIDDLFDLEPGSFSL